MYTENSPENQPSRRMRPARSRRRSARPMTPAELANALRWINQRIDHYNLKTSTRTRPLLSAGTRRVVFAWDRGGVILALRPRWQLAIRVGDRLSSIAVKDVLDAMIVGVA